jgi:hypothetical protein
MAEKPEYVDLISARTRQHRRRPPQRLASPPEPPEEERRLSRWPPARFAQFKLETFMPWKTKSWTTKD